MALIISTDAVEVQRLAAAQVTHDPLRNTIFSAIAVGVQHEDAAPWAAHPEDDPGVLAARSQRYTPVAFTEGWDQTAPAAAALAVLDPPAAAIAGPVPTVDALCAALDRPVARRMDERLHRLDELVAPRHVPGSARVADRADASLLARWLTAFTLEAFGRLSPGFDADQLVRRGLLRARSWLWLDAEGVPRSLAVRQPVVNGVARIGPVYTPPDARGHGYASAATAAASREILDEQAVACLFTDLANPTSNHIYRALGYVPVADRSVVSFR